MINMECDMAKNVMMIVRMVMVSRVMMDGNGKVVLCYPTVFALFQSLKGEVSRIQAPLSSTAEGTGISYL